MGLRYASTANTTYVPAYTRVDAMVQRSFKFAQNRKVKLQLNLFNVFNQTYYESVYAGHVIVGTKRSAQLGLEYDF